jgi:branched-chain amino acid transport system permease protein
MTMLIIGGAGFLYGGLLGAAAFVILHDVLSGLNPVYWQFWLGFALVLIVLFMHDGLLGAGRRWAAKAARARRRPTTPPGEGDGRA